jgi:hypothetical protein
MFALTYARLHPWFGVDEQGATFYATDLFSELDDLLADIDIDAESIVEDVESEFPPCPTCSPSPDGHPMPALGLHPSGVVCDRSQTMGTAWGEGTLTKALQSETLLMADEVNRLD